MICYPVKILLATVWTFTKDTAVSEQGRGTAWQGNGMLHVNKP